MRTRLMPRLRTEDKWALTSTNSVRKAKELLISPPKRKA